MRYKLNSSRQLYTAAAISSLILVACGENGKVEDIHSQVNIVGGRAIPEDVSDARRVSTVALTTDHRSVRRPSSTPLFDSSRSFCSATVISKKALLTAAHCIQDFDPQTKLKGDSWILPTARDFIASFGIKVGKQGAWIRAKKVVPHPEWDPLQTLSGNPNRAPHDIGIVILEDEIPSNYQPVEVASENFELKEKQQVTLVGFGVTLSRRNNNTGLLREVQLPLQGVDKKSQTLNVGSWMKGACAGDSGGPMYTQDANGKWLVVGVTSAGIEIFQTCIGLDNSYTDARAHKNWIRSVLQGNNDDLL